jgi:hypothetical protein
VTLANRPIDPLQIVNSADGTTRYHCPNVATVDLHLAELARRVASAARLPKLVAKYRADIDRLLEHRLFLSDIAELGDDRADHPG